jgi:putative endonuclease
VARTFYVYIIASKTRVLYIGVTANIHLRVFQHKRKLVPGFTRQYNVTRLVYVESTSDVRAAIQREKQLKGWRRDKKLELVASMNPEWLDLVADWFEIPPPRP